MIIRLVKMEFKLNEIDTFRLIFKETKPLIEKMEGCLLVNLHQDAQHPEIFFTISHWESEMDLDHYRHSELFIKTWKKVKLLFDKKAEAWSLKA
ncbi:MAG: antibiotic biosynthesis monooxygenase [Sphingobacteriales bacterium]|nr:antibiotic biosynthesis monooxygenase [Sphingobacteriales bacterium]